MIVRQNRKMLGHVAFVLAMVAVVFLAKLISDYFNVPYTIVLTVCGLVYAVLPGPNLQIEPEVVLVILIPPLLYSAARRSSLLAIRANWRPIISLSVILVLLTAFAVGFLVSLVVPGVPIAAGLVLGAAVAPPDPVAALSVGRRAGMPPRLGTLIGGEGLLNDATALTTYQVAVAATVGAGFSWAVAGGKFLLAAGGGLLIGAAIGLLLRLARPIMTDPLLANTASLAAPFVAYLIGEELHVSGVLAVVIAGLMAGHDAPRLESGARLQTGAVWQLVEFLLEGLVFLLIGQQLPEVIKGLRDEPTGTILAAAGMTLVAVLLVRPLWLVLTQMVPGWFGWRMGDPYPTLNGREVIALSWAGTRGVITLGAIFAIPLTTKSGAPFPGRNLLLLCAYVVVLVTLVGQGLTFAPLLHKLKLKANPTEEAQLRNEARLAAVEAAKTVIDEMQVDHQIPTETGERMHDVLQQRADRYRARIDMLQATEDDDVTWTPEFEAAVRARHAVIDAQRDELLRWRDSGRLPDESLRKLQRELDHEESTLPGR
jgi:CPA1 family monovalent cation:H+ antiporter